jgi:hypothetical protein
MRQRDAFDDPMAERRLGALLAAAREARPERTAPTPDRVAPAQAPTPPQRSAAETFARPQPRSAMETYVARATEARRRNTLDDELFADEPLTLNDVRGARR